MPMVEKDLTGVGEGKRGFAIEGDMKEAEDENQDEVIDGGEEGRREGERESLERAVDSIILPRGCDCGCCATVSPELSEEALSKGSVITGGFDLVHSSLQCSEARSVHEAVEDRPRIAAGGRLRKP